ncbi:mu-type opioid receptor-like [Lineus longissimus]|uniref:mu-type opioid receptor-like n=1 Tax=Lineus longissimus TaxID=88925 RepID=UPI00315D54C9
MEFDVEASMATVRDDVDHEVLVLRIVYIIVTKYSWIIIAIVGLFGNVMSIIITLQKKNRHISTCNYMTALALADTMVLIELIWAMILMFWTTDPLSEFAMQTMWYQSYSFGILSGFYLAEMTIDRLIAVKFPMAARRLCTTRRAFVTIVVTFIVIGGLNLYIYFTYRYVQDNETDEGVFRMSVPHAPELETLGNASQLAFGTILPFCVIVFCNVWIIVVVRNASHERDLMGVGDRGQKTREKETTYLIRMLILVSIAYVLTSIPYRLYDTLIGIPVIRVHYNLSEEYWFLRFNSQDFIMLQFWEINYGINFYLYCIGGGKKYRSDVKQRFRQIITCCKM